MSTRKKKIVPKKPIKNTKNMDTNIIIDTDTPVSSSPNYKFCISGISAHNIINLHFDDFSTKLLITNVDNTIIDSTTDNNTIINNSEINHETFINNSINAEIVTNYDEEENFNISNLKHNSDKIGKRAIYFLDNKKNQVKLWPNMIDITVKGPLPLYTNIPCRNCHQPYTTHPLGCPIRYNPNNSDNSPIKKQIEKFLKENNFSTISNDYFETEYMFCTIPCIKSYILTCLSKNSSCKYGDSLTYLTLMYKKINENSNFLEESKNSSLNSEILPIIPAAQPIEILKTNGGHLSIEEYRSCSGILQYNETVNIKRPLMFSSSILFQESCI